MGRGSTPVLLAALLTGAAASAGELTLLQNGQGLSGLSRSSLDVAASPDGRHVYAVTSFFVLALARQADGRLAPLEGADVGEYPLGAPGAGVVAPTDGAGVLLLLTTSEGASQVESYRRDAESGRLTFVDVEFANLGLAASLAVSGDGTRIYLPSPSQDGVVVYGRDPGSGSLAFLQRVRQQDAGVDGLDDPVAAAVSPDDRHVYVSASIQDQGGFRGTIVLLRREPDGSLAFVEAVETGPLATDFGLIDLLVLPDGSEVLGLDGSRLAQPSGGVLRFARAPDDGRLSFLERISLPEPGPFGDSANWMALRPDARRLYVGGSTSQAGRIVWVYARDASGALSLREGFELPMAGFLSGGDTSPEGGFVYTAGAQGVRVLAPEADAAGAALAVLAGLALSRRPGRRRG